MHRIENASHAMLTQFDEGCNAKIKHQTPLKYEGQVERNQIMARSRPFPDEPL